MTDVERLSLAHALRTPLTSALLSAGLLADGSLDPTQRQLVEMLLEDLLRLRVLVEQGLDIARAGAHAGPMERAPVRLADLLWRAVTPLLPQAASRDIVVDLDVEAASGGDAVVLADPVKLGWACTTLVANAIRFAKSLVHVQARVSEDQVSVEVRDDGPGVAPSIADRLFERDGAGLGLFLVREFVAAHGGAVELLSSSAAGSIFALHLPLAPSREGTFHGEAR
jgi:two-component system sensor histidine kinase GlrK